MSTDHIDALLRNNATKELDCSIAIAAGAFRSAVVDLWAQQGYSDIRDARSMVLNAIFNDPYEREHLKEWMDAESTEGAGRAKAIATIHARLAKELLEKVERLGNEVDELRNEVDYHDHN